MLRTTPFEVVYGRPPPALLPYEPSSARTDTVDALLRNRDTFLADIHDQLLQAQAYAKCHYDAHHRPLEFAVRAWVWLRMLHRPTQSLVPCKRDKLSPRYAGPFQVLERMGDVAYHLQLPEGARIHDVFHIGVLKPYHRTPPTLPPLQHGRLLQAPEQALRAQLRLGTWHVLVQWAGLPEAEATWEPVDSLRAAHPEFQLEDELFLNGGRDVMVGEVYHRKKHTHG